MLLLRHKEEYFNKYQNSIGDPTNGLKYGDCQLEDIWRWVCGSQACGHDICKTHYIEKRKKPALP